MDICLAVDIGGTKIAISVIDSNGKLCNEIKNIPIPFNSKGLVVPERFIDIIKPFVVCANQDHLNLHGLGLSICGNVNAETGEAILVPNLHWHHVPFGEMVHDAFGLPVYVAMDSRDAALAEHIWGAARGVSHFVWATVGTGYGGYLYLDNKLYGGVHGFAGNFGHITLDEINGYPCGCGRRGCYETFVAGPAIARLGQASAESGRSKMLANMALETGNITSLMVFQACEAGDPVANEIIEGVVRLIAINLGGVVNLLDLEMIILGGGVVNASLDFVARIDRRIRTYLMTEEAKRDLMVVKESFPNSALFGAAADVFIHTGILQDK